MNHSDMKPCKVGEVLRMYDSIQKQIEQTSDMIGRAALAGEDTIELAKGLGELQEMRNQFLRRTVWTEEKLV